MVSVAASRYARALADVTFDPRSGLDPHSVTEQLGTVAALVKSSTELQHVLVSPAVPNSRKRAIIEKLAPELGLNPKVRNFIYVLIDHRRIGQIGEIQEAYQSTVDERMGLVRADVTSARDLTDEQRGAVQAELGRLTGKQIRMEYSVDPALIGGLVARVGSTVYDGSVRGQLEALRQRLVAES
jgi:F-type H+-transporting ATPase subunit delta